MKERRIHGRILNLLQRRIWIPDSTAAAFIGMFGVFVSVGLSFALLGTVAAASALPIPMQLFSETRAREAPARQIPTSTTWEMSAPVHQWTHFFTTKDRPRFDRFMKRGALYRGLIQKILVENGVPGELYYLAMIESGFSRQARSRARAVGTWQFIAPTARRYGLRVDSEVDERLDVIRSTRAAAKYLKDLKHEFGSWYLAMAAYNCGENRVRRAVRRTHTNDFWRLARMRALPNETINYIPKFHAAMLIAKNPARYGFAPKVFYEFPTLRGLRVGERVRLTDVARRKHLAIQTVVALNPHLLRGRTPSGSSYVIWLPTPRVAHGRQLAVNDRH